MYTNFMGLLTKCDNIIYSRIDKTTEEERLLAEKIQKKLLGNYKLTKKEREFLK